MTTSLILLGIGLLIGALTLLYAAGKIGPKEVDKTALFIERSRKHLEEVKRRLGIGGDHDPDGKRDGTKTP